MSDTAHDIINGISLLAWIIVFGFLVREVVLWLRLRRKIEKGQGHG